MAALQVRWWLIGTLSRLRGAVNGRGGGLTRLSPQAAPLLTTPLTVSPTVAVSALGTCSRLRPLSLSSPAADGRAWRSRGGGAGSARGSGLGS